jgi:lipoprotein-anchoring transpeptidase ErfK/SrfK
MRRFRGFEGLSVRIAAAAIAAFIVILATTNARADIAVRIDKSNQLMSVAVDGAIRHDWRISTGLGGGPPSGAFRPQRLEREWNSRKYGWAPMPHAIFFHDNYAIHGTPHVARLGRRVSKGCVRLHPVNAATLFTLVQKNGFAKTRIIVESRNRNLRRQRVAADDNTLIR